MSSVNWRGEAELVEDDADHDRAHPWWVEGCGGCQDRAARREAEAIDSDRAGASSRRRCEAKTCPCVLNGAPVQRDGLCADCLAL